jgi:cytochrome o ubiquinol oxidase subunit 1
VLPDVRDIDAFSDMKSRGVAYHKPDRYSDIDIPKNTGAGVVLAVLAAAFGFAMVWHIWWMAIASAVGMWAVIIARTYNDDTEYRLSADEVEKIESQRYQTLASALRSPSVNRPVLSNQPLPESLT